MDINSLQTFFTNIYRTNHWSSNESKSGPGSELKWTVSVRDTLTKLFNELKIKNMLDLSCGDWNWMKSLSHLYIDDFKYTGLDIVENIVDNNNKLYGNNNIIFKNIDMLRYLKSLESKSVDLILCRHTLEHLQTEYCINVLQEMKRVSKYTLITTHKITSKNTDLDHSRADYRPINLEIEPFSLILNRYFHHEYYDGPSETEHPECRIILYQFI